MLLTDLAESLTAHLNTNKDKWTTEDILVKTELDPMLCMLSALGVYIMPNYILYLIDNAKVRDERVQITQQLMCSLIVSKVFTGLPTGDGVANWSEAKPIIDTRQRTEECLLEYGNSALTLASVETQDVQEVELDNRNFIALSTFAYEQVVCVSAHVLRSLSVASKRESPLERIRDSIKSRHLSDQKPGNL
jgi:hypothetical protein